MADDGLGRHEQEGAVCHPPVVEHAPVLIGALEWIAPEVVKLRCAQRHQRLSPHVQTVGALFHERDLPGLDAQRHQVTVITPVEKSLAGVVLHLTLDEGQEVVAANVDLEGLGRTCNPS